MHRLVVVMPTLNQGHFLERTLVSVLKQLGKDDALVVVDGDSKDRTHTILEKYSDRITHVEVNADLNQAAALKWGFDNYPAKYASYLNSDDLYLPGAVESALNYLNSQPGAVATYSHRVAIDSADRIQWLWRLPPHSNYLMSRWDYIPQETCFWRYRDMQDCGGIDPFLEFAMDYDLFVRLMQRGVFHRANNIRAAFRVHPEAKTSRLNDTVGKREVNAIMARQQIKFHSRDRIVGSVLRRIIKRRSAVWFKQLRVQKEVTDKIDRAISGLR